VEPSWQPLNAGSSVPLLHRTCPRSSTRCVEIKFGHGHMALVGREVREGNSLQIFKTRVSLKSCRCRAMSNGVVPPA
jgi:hypothetical protein